MQFEGQYTLNATPAAVWEALNSEVVLAHCIPGCESVKKHDDGAYAATVTLKVGPVKARFAGDVNIKQIEPLKRYRVEGEGKGGVAGFARGAADVSLEEVSGGTELSYTVDAKIGGKIAQLGSRMLNSTVQKLSDKFFENFTEVLNGNFERASFGELK